MKFIALRGFFAAIKNAWGEYAAMVREGMETEKNIADEEWWENHEYPLN